MPEFYVYGLIDPRTNAIFYIGKGKGKRVFQHQKEKEDLHGNSEKLKIIREIKDEGFEVRHILIGEDLDEEAAYLLEKILIYRLGRKIFDEGFLANIVPGGKWHKESSYFLKKGDIPSPEMISEQFPELIPILEKFPNTAKEFIGLRCPIDPKDDKLYVFSDTGEKIHEWNIDEFIQIFGLGHALELINVLKTTSKPVYAWNRIWSKTKFESLGDVSRISFQEFAVLDID